MAFSLSLTIKNVLKDIFKLKNDKIDASRIEGTIPIESLPPASIERVKVVQDEATRLALTKATVQNGDTVKVKDTKKMYFVVDDTKLDQEAGYEEYVSGGAASAEIAEKAKLALDSEKLGGLTIEALRTEIKGYPANIQNGSIKNQHLAADFSFPGNKLADGSITNNKLAYKSITLDKIADGVLTAANVDAYNKGEINQSFRKIGNKIISGNVDWDTLIEPTTYNISGINLNDAFHAPKEYNYGILVVNRLENGKDGENRTIQIYYPHFSDNTMKKGGIWIRFFNYDEWSQWRHIPSEAENNERYVNKSGDTMTGILTVPTVSLGSGYIGDFKRDVGDAITDNSGANVNIASWFGVGFYSTQTKRYTGTMDLRTGNWRTLGRIKADNGFEGKASSANIADFAIKIKGNKLIFENGTELWIE